jgi:transposase
MRTQLKNRVHKHLSSCGVKLSSCIGDIFGKSGKHILNGLVNGTRISDILKSIPSGVIKKKEDLIKVSISNGLDKITRILVRDLLDLLDSVESKIEATSRMIAEMLQTNAKDLAIIMSIPGIGFVAILTLRKS